ncbi:MAG: T9SS type A sorting domain-containing protein [bacterium]|nr:T9SS type A sorting domain-containing protein [bacterium]
MKKMILALSCCFLGLGSTMLFAQSGYVAAGGNASGTGGTVSFSIGQVFYVAPSSSAFNLVQGVQQPFEISTVTGLDQSIKGIDLLASVYPNPASETLTLRVENGKWFNLSYVLYDITGREITKGKVENEETKLDVSPLAIGQYFLKVSEGSQLVKTFQILKSY